MDVEPAATGSRSAVPGRDNAVLGPGLSISVAERPGVFGHYDAGFNGRDQLHAGTGGLVVTWQAPKSTLPACARERGGEC